MSSHEARQVTLIEVVVHEGRGTEGNPHRLVTYYHRLDGTCVARRDKWEEEGRRGSSSESTDS